MKSLFLAALVAFAFLSSTHANAQQYRESYYDDSHNSAAYLVGALIHVAAHSAYDGRSNYYGGNRYSNRRDRHYDRYNYTPRYRSYRNYGNYRNYNSYPAYRGRHYQNRYDNYRGRHHGRRN